ncbi:hypothetical protein M569_04923, partial [Genlisea aurea]
MGKKDKSFKRKKSETQVFTPHGFVVGSDKNGAEVIDDLNEPTMGEKLSSLYLDVDKNSAPVVKPPSADSLYILLKQALRADDRALIMECIMRQDEKVIKNSLSLLDPCDALNLLLSLISIIQLRGNVVSCAIPWLRSLLLQHASPIISQESSLAALNSLHQAKSLLLSSITTIGVSCNLIFKMLQLIESRVSNFSSALQLSSALDLFYAESIDEDKVDDPIVPAIYEDTESEEEDSMEVEGSSGEEVQVRSDICD